MGVSVAALVVPAHHYQWWPSMVTIVDDAWHRRGTFVNAGWIERVHWLSPDRLLVAGFSEAFDGGVVALLDPNALDGQGPVAADSRFYCTACGAGHPLRYVVMPRSEVNRITGSRFNRAVLQLGSDRIIVRTIEVPSDSGDAVDAIYEFTPSLDLIHASFSECYLEVRRTLEAEGKLNRVRDQDPGRDSPPDIKIWTPDAGWTTQKLRWVSWRDEAAIMAVVDGKSIALNRWSAVCVDRGGMFRQERITETRDAERRAFLKTPALAGVPVRNDDIETPTGLHCIARLFRVMAAVVIVLMGIQIVNGVTAAGQMSVSQMATDAIRLLLFAGVLWGAGDLADLLVKSHCDLRATRILLGRLTHLVGQHPALREPRAGDTLRRRSGDIAH